MLGINHQSNILSYFGRFDTTINWQILEKEFETRSADFITEEILVKLDLHISILGHLEEGPLCLIKLPKGNTKENKQVIGLDTPAAILDNNQQLNLLNLNDLKAEWAKKKEKKAQKQ